MCSKHPRVSENLQSESLNTGSLCLLHPASSQSKYKEQEPANSSKRWSQDTHFFPCGEHKKNSGWTLQHNCV